MGYGMTEHGLSIRTKKTVEEAKQLIEDYFAKLSRLRPALFEETKESLLQYGCIRTIFGNYWHLDDMQKLVLKEVLAKKNDYSFKRRYKDIWQHPVLAGAVRQAGNSKIQGPTHNMVVLGMNKFNKIARQTWSMYDVGDCGKAQVYLQNEIHDSVVVDVAEGMEDEVAPILLACMQNPEPPFEFPVPWVGDVKVGTSMYKKHQQSVAIMNEEEFTNLPTEMHSDVGAIRFQTDGRWLKKIVGTDGKVQVERIIVTGV